MRIFLSDLTYNTNRVSTEALPINIGYIASYCLKKFPNDVEISLFKYHQELEKAIEENPPDVLGLSNYIWNSNLSIEILNKFSKINPDGLRVMGGPNFPLDAPSQRKFFEEIPNLDIYVPDEGEIGFLNMIEKSLQFSQGDFRKSLIEEPIDGCIIRNQQGRLLYSFSNTRLRNLDEIPSPYTMGILDKFFDENLIPMLQTNRGCPFTCTFCTDGRDSVRQVNRFSADRIRDDLEYMATHVKKSIHSMFISDLNFGMLPGDLDTCNTINNIKKQYNYPHRIISTTGKNNKEKIIESIKSLGGTLSLSMSVQSLDANVLKNIRRDNISTDKMLALAPTIKKYNLNTTAEIILGLPGETYQSHLQTIRDLVNAKLDDIISYTCLILPGSEMGTPEQRQKWKMHTKYQILPEDFATLKDGKRVCEFGEYIVSTKDMSFDEYVDLRTISFTLWMTNRGIMFDPLLKFLRQEKIDVADLFFEMVNHRDSAPESVREVYESFQKTTREESFDSKEEILEKIKMDEFYQQLLDEKIGMNVIRYHHAVTLVKCMDEWTEYVLTIAKQLLQNENKLEKVKNKFEEIGNFCRGTTYNPLGKDRQNTNPEYTFQYDIRKWMEENSDELKLEEFLFQEPVKGIFRFSDEKFKVVKDSLNLYGNTFSGFYKGLKMVPQYVLCRDFSQNYNNTDSTQNNDKKSMNDSEFTDNTTNFSSLD